MPETAGLGDEVAGLTQGLLRLNTVNPPGNETPAAELLRTYLEENGVECQLFARAPERANLVARLRGRGEGPSLLLLSHTDTVVADPEEWELDPWSGEIRGGEVWGRGALDMKGQVAASAVAIAYLARSGFQPAGDLVFAAVADEEVGDGYGLSWLCETYPDAIKTDYCLNEGGGDRVVVRDQPIYLCATAEKASSPFVLRAFGRSGHGSIPGIADNALTRAARLLTRLASFRACPRFRPETELLVKALLGQVPDPENAVKQATDLHASLGSMVEPMLGLTVSPTMIEASQQLNVIPAVCDVVCDCRLLPGQSRADAEEELRRCLGPEDYRIIWLDAEAGGTSSPLDTALWSVIEDFVEAEEPGADLTSMLLPGFTDSHYVRNAFGTVAYGFFPMRRMEPELASRLVHSANERIPIDDLELGARFLIHAARTLGT